MQNRLFLPILLFVALAIGGCRNDFEVNDTWKEIDIIYGLLDKNDSADYHYIRINKAFLNTGKNAIDIAQNMPDSIYHKDSLDVTMAAWSGSVKMSEMKLVKVPYEKDSGLFSYPGAWLYRTKGPYPLDSTLTYTLNVVNTKTGVAAKSRTAVLGNIDPFFPSSGNPDIDFVRKVSTIIDFTAGNNVRFYDLNFYIHYSERNKADTSKVQHFVLRWPVFHGMVVNQRQHVKYAFPGDAFFDVLKGHLEKNNAVARKIEYIDYELLGGAEDIYNYIQINTPTISVVQKKPDFTNIENGYGVFSSRSHYRLRLSVGRQALEQLATEDLGFIP